MDVLTLVSEYGLVVYIAVLAVSFIILFFWMMMLIDCIKRRFRMKYMWLALLLVFSIPASWIYYFAVKRPALGLESASASRHVREQETPVRKKLEKAGALKPEEKPEEPPEQKTGDEKTAEARQTPEEPQAEEQTPDVEQPGATLDELKESAQPSKPEIVR